MDHEVAAQAVLDLFEGRTNAWGGDEGRAVYGPVDRQLVLGHLTGVQPIGIYPVRFAPLYMEQPEQFTQASAMDNMFVKWGCCDIDTGDWSEAYTLWKCLAAMGMKPYVERSRSKGWHVWVFSDEWVPAYIMRRALKVAYQAIDLPAKEANPKSEFLRPNQLGNYVRLPYRAALTDDPPVRQVVMAGFTPTDDGKPIKLSDFLTWDVKTPAATIRKWAAKWYEPPKRLVVTDRKIAEGSDLERLIASLTKPLHKLWVNGPSNGDTSQGLMALAHNTAQAGWKPEDVFSLVAAADMRWGKFHERNDFESYIEDIVERAYK